jgi:carboxyl-terminal processing protease
MRLASVFAVALALVAVAAACGHDTTAPAPPPPTALAVAPFAPSVASQPASSHEGEDDPNAPPPREPFTNAAAAFASAKESILKNYYSEAVTEDDLYRAALQGMLERVEPRLRKYNRLLSPADLAEIRSDLKGELVGIGVAIHFEPDTGYIDILTPFPGSPAEKAGLLAGDKILSVNGKLFRGMHEKDVVHEIRGVEGEPVSLSVLRGDKVVAFTIKRARVVYEPGRSAMFPEGVGYVHLHAFNARSAAFVRSLLEDLAKKGPRALVVDLRENQGGSFEDAVAAAELMLPAGAPIVKVVKRGGKEEAIAAKGSGILASLPCVVLVNGDTSSGAEFVAAALRESRKAQIVGTKTFGKWSVQTIEDLSNGYAIKYTVSQFRAPSGRSFEGTGLAPDVEVALDPQACERALLIGDTEKRLAADPQLRTAIALLK